jgi:hypothetical protein
MHVVRWDMPRAFTAPRSKHPGPEFSLLLKIDGEVGHMDADCLLGRISPDESAIRTNESVLIKENRPFMPDCFLTTGRSKESRCHSPAGKWRINAPFCQKSHTPVALDRPSDWLWSPATFRLLL